MHAMVLRSAHPGGFVAPHLAHRFWRAAARLVDFPVYYSRMYEFGRVGWLIPPRGE